VPEIECFDAIDNDSDEMADYQDPDCNEYYGNGDGDGGSYVAQTCAATEADLDGDCFEEMGGCTDAYDNDANGSIDCEDGACAGRGACAGVTGSGLENNWNAGGPNAGDVKAEDAKPIEGSPGDGDGVCCVFHVATDPVRVCKDSSGGYGPIFETWAGGLESRLGDACDKVVQVATGEATVNGTDGADYSEECKGYDDIRVYTFGHSEPDRCDCPFVQAEGALEAVTEIGVKGTGSSVSVVDIGCATWRGGESEARARAEAMAERLRQTNFQGKVIVRANRAYALFPGQGGDEFGSGCPTEFHICAEGVTEKNPCPTDGSGCACRPGSTRKTYEAGASYSCEDDQGAKKTATCTVNSATDGAGWADCTWEVE
jgi:hypothetical protein